MVHLHNGILHRKKKKEFLSFATAWIELETITLNEISQLVKDKYHMTNEQNKLKSITEPDTWKHGTD